MLGFMAVAAIWLWVANIYPFLAVTERLDADVLVVEGWVHCYAIVAGVEEFRAGGYRRVFATGGAVAGTGAYASDYKTAAHVGAGLLRSAGLPEESLEMVPSRVNGRDRTYGSAIALREHFRQRGMEIRGLNVVTENVHARRTRLLYQQAFGPDVKVGIIAAVNPDYDAHHWWRYSAGVRDVLGEFIAYIYAKVWFTPDGGLSVVEQPAP